MSKSQAQRKREAEEAAKAAQEQANVEHNEDTTGTGQAGEEVDPLAGLSDDNANPFVEQLLQQASDLEDEKAALLKRIGANRDTLRVVRNTGFLSEKQSAAIDLWYPPRTRKTADAEPEQAAEPEQTAA